jgi:UDP-glucuronate 4-epimerase
MSGDPILVTGAAGFIGFHVARRLLESGRAVVGLDNLNAYYDPTLKDARLAELAKFEGFRFTKLDLADRAGMAALFAEHRFPAVVHLAAQAGVRYSLVDPHAYVSSALPIFSKAAGTMAASICCLRPRRRFTARIQRCRFPFTTTSIIR